MVCALAVALDIIISVVATIPIVADRIEPPE
jgi:hypothetical protein